MKKVCIGARLQACRKATETWSASAAEVLNVPSQCSPPSFEDVNHVATFIRFMCFYPLAQGRWKLAGRALQEER